MEIHTKHANDRRPAKGQLALRNLLCAGLLLVALLTACAPTGQPAPIPKQTTLTATAPATTVAASPAAALTTSPAPSPSPSAPVLLPAPALAVPSATLATLSATTVSSGVGQFELPGERVYPEGIAVDAAARFFYIGSLADGTLMRGNLETGAVTVFSPAGADVRATVVGLEVDATRRRFWVAGGSAGRMYVYDLDTARLLRQYVVPASTPAALINDVSVTPAGDAFFTDSRRPLLWRIGASGRDAPGDLEPWLDLSGGTIPHGASLNLNGIIGTPDGLHLIAVHTGASRLFRFAIASREVREIALNAPLQNGDGLALDGATLFVVAGGRIARVGLAPGYERGVVRDTFAHPSFLYPTTLRKVRRPAVRRQQPGQHALQWQPDPAVHDHIPPYPAVAVTHATTRRVNTATCRCP